MQLGLPGFKMGMQGCRIPCTGQKDGVFRLLLHDLICQARQAVAQGVQARRQGQYFSCRGGRKAFFWPIGAAFPACFSIPHTNTHLCVQEGRHIF